MKYLIRFFSLLDLVSIALLTTSVFTLLGNLGDVPHQPLSIIRTCLLVLVYFSLFASAIGLMMLKKWGAVVYYVQFVIRLVVWIFSFGWLTLIDQYTGADLFDLLFKVVVILEFFRLYFTVTVFKKPQGIRF